MNEDIKDLLQMIHTTSKHLDARLTLDSGCCKCLIDYINYLKERMAYLERSNNRREETILCERDENIGLYSKIDKAIKIMEDYTLFDLKADKVMKVIKILKGDDKE